MTFGILQMFDKNVYLLYFVHDLISDHTVFHDPQNFSWCAKFAHFTEFGTGMWFFLELLINSKVINVHFIFSCLLIENRVGAHDGIIIITENLSHFHTLHNPKKKSEFGKRLPRKTVVLKIIIFYISKKFQIFIIFWHENIVLSFCQL